MTTRRLLALMQSVCVAALLSACGGGGGTDAPAPAQPGPLEQVPGSASQSSAGMTGYLRALGALTPEDREPVDIGNFTPPTVDDAEPEPVS
ncbi:MAG: hypothetical protein AB1430_06640 [Pseudomonadota bacterium]